MSISIRSIQEFPMSQIYSHQSTLSRTIEIILCEEFASIATIIEILNTFSVLSEFIQGRVYFWYFYATVKKKKKKTQLQVCVKSTVLYLLHEPLLHLPRYLRGVSLLILYLHYFLKASVWVVFWFTLCILPAMLLSPCPEGKHTKKLLAFFRTMECFVCDKIILTIILTPSLKYHTFLAVCKFCEAIYSRLDPSF